MIPDFEAFTEELNDYERKTLLPYAIEYLSRHIGKNNAVTNHDIREHFLRGGMDGVCPSRVRKIVNFIRRRNLVPRLAASSNGYYVCDNDYTYQRYMKGLIARRDAISEVIRCMLEREGLKEEDVTIQH